MDGFKMSLDLAMPTEQPDKAPLCDECSMKHGPRDDCWEGILPAGELPLPVMNKYATGREMIDNGADDKPEEGLDSEKAQEESLVDKLKSGAIRMAKKVNKKEKKRDS